MKRRLIFSEDGGALAGGRTCQLYGSSDTGVKAYLRELFEPLTGTHVDTFVWSMGNTHQFSYDTRVGERFHDYVLESSGNIDAVWNWRWWRNLKDLIESGNDPPRLIVKATRDLGLESFASLRMNDSHDAFMPSLASRIKAEHPDWLIGEPGRDYVRHGDPYFPEWLVTKPREHVEWWMRKAFNYAVPEVRAYILAMVDEITDYGFNGMELDFMTLPYIFRLGEEEEHMELLTGLVRDIRSLLDRKGGDGEGPRLLMARVPANIDRCRRIGIDVETWIADGLVDLLSIGRSYMPFSIPTREWVEAVEGTSCRVYPSMNLSVGGVREEYKTVEAMRAFSMLHHSAGADGIYLFNYGLRDDIGLGEIGEPSIIEHRNKLYIVDNPIVIDTVMFHSIPDELIPLPVELKAAGDRAVVGFEIGDNLERNEVREITLKMEASNLTEEDQLGLSLNGADLVGGKETPSFNDYSIEYPLAAPPLRKGHNELEAHLKKRNPLIGPPVQIGSLHVSIEYIR